MPIREVVEISLSNFPPTKPRFVVFRAFCAKYSQMLPLYGSRLDSMNPYVWLITEQMRKILNELPPSLHGLQVIIHSFEKSL